MEINIFIFLYFSKGGTLRGFTTSCYGLWCVHTRARQRQDKKTNVEPVHSYDAFHTRHVGPGVKGIIGMHRFNICLGVLVWCENTITLQLLSVNCDPGHCGEVCSW